jgi:hypothetical protein
MEMPGNPSTGDFALIHSDVESVCARNGLQNLHSLLG